MDLYVNIPSDSFKPQKRRENQRRYIATMLNLSNKTFAANDQNNHGAQ